MKRIGLAILLLTGLLLCVSGCGNSKNTTVSTSEDFSDKNVYRPMGSFTESDKGIYEIQWKNEYTPILFTDKVSGKRTVLCNKVNCKHDSTDCPAIEDGIMGCLTYSDEMLYFMAYKIVDGYPKLELFSMNEDGSEKKKIHTFENAKVFPNQAGLFKGKIILSAATIEETEDGTGAATAEPSIIIYELDTKKETVILDGAMNKDKYTVPCGGCNDGFYLAQMSWDDGNPDKECIYLKYSFENESIEEIYRTKEYNLQMITNNTLYLQSEGNSKIESYNIEKSQYKDIMTLEEKCDQIRAREDHIEFIKETEIDGEKHNIVNWYDIETEEFLFDEFQDADKIRVMKKTDKGYLIYKDGEPYFYNHENKKWQSVENIG